MNVTGTPQFDISSYSKNGRKLGEGELLNRVLDVEAEAIDKFGYSGFSKWKFLPVKII